jgi:hypothetical protein
LADWLWWGETDVSELRPLRAYCSSSGGCDVDHGMVSTGANFWLVYQSALVVLSAEISRSLLYFGCAGPYVPYPRLQEPGRYSLNLTTRSHLILMLV